MPTARIDGRDLGDWASFHRVFAAVFDFPDWYGHNMDAWIDCMSSLDTGDDPVVIHIDEADAVPDAVFAELVACAAFVNWRRVEAGEPIALALSYWRTT